MELSVTECVFLLIAILGLCFICWASGFRLGMRIGAAKAFNQVKGTIRRMVEMAIGGIYEEERLRQKASDLEIQI